MPHEFEAAGRLFGDDFTLPNATQIEPSPVEWLWPGRIAYRQLTIIEGDPGLGKSMLTAAIAAAVTGGPPLPGAEPMEPANCVFANLEDHPASVTIPRLRAAGADLTRVHVPQMGSASRPRWLSLPADLDRVWQMMDITDSRLLIIDPLMAALGTEINSDSDQQVRTVLNDLRQTAAGIDAAVVIVRHLNKQGGRKAIYRGGGSIGIAAAARSVLLLSRDIRSAGLVLTTTKQNLAAHPPALALHIDASESGGRIVWDGERRVTSDQMLLDESAPQRPGQLEAATSWLTSNLCDATLPSRDVLAATSEAGIQEVTLRRAAKLIGVEASKQPGSKTSPWHWSLTGEICKPD